MIVALGVVIAAAGGAVAPARFETIDAGADGRLRHAERIDAFGVAGADALWLRNGARERTPDDG